MKNETQSVSRKTVWIFALTIFLSAFLLFQVQLIISKYILAWFGGASAVWTTSMLVFQILLLAGYSYSHLVSERLAHKTQSKLHLGILTAACVIVLGLSWIWPSAITPAISWKPLSSTAPIRDLITILLLAVGLPYFVLSTTGPLLQRWFSQLGGDARTYRMYSVSNIGSLLGLLTFPFLLEPALRMPMQGRVWSCLFFVFAAGCAWCAWKAHRGDADGVEFQPPGEDPTSEAPPIKSAVLLRLLWVMLPFCASALLLATTNLLCQQIASIPLLWVLPLVLYLFSFILCFDHPRWYRREIFNPLLAFGIPALCLAILYFKNIAALVLMPVLLFVACMICHGEVVRLKPNVKSLTSFYLAISAGGAMGGVFVGIIAPQIFSLYTEYQIALGATVLLLICCLVLDSDSWLHHMNLAVAAGITAGILAAALGAGWWIPEFAAVLDKYKFYPAAVLVGIAVLAASFLGKSQNKAGWLSFLPSQLLVIALAAICISALYKSAETSPQLYLSKRSFYGSLRVNEVRLLNGGKELMHGQTLHGVQMNSPYDRAPLTYYFPESGIGALLRNHPKRSQVPSGLRVGVVGMGVGTLAAYGLPGDYFRFYEINPDVIELSSGARPIFTFIRDSQAEVALEQGDARLLLEREAVEGNLQDFDVLVLDAFSGDAIPVHLLTVEAFETYWKHVNANHGVIAIHISCRHVDLLPVVEGAARHFQAYTLMRLVLGSYPYQDNEWVFMARDPQDLQVNGLIPTPPRFGYKKPRIWTDDYSDIVSLLY